MTTLWLGLLQPSSLLKLLTQNGRSSGIQRNYGYPQLKGISQQLVIFLHMYLLLLMVMARSGEYRAYVQVGNESYLSVFSVYETLKLDANISTLTTWNRPWFTEHMTQASFVCLRRCLPIYHLSCHELVLKISTYFANFAKEFVGCFWQFVAMSRNFQSFVLFLIQDSLVIAGEKMLRADRQTDIWTDEQTEGPVE